jgi:fluoride exporter
MPRRRAGATSIAGPRSIVSERRWQAVAIATGGALGTLARYGVDRGISGPALGFPWATFAVNIAGSLILGYLVIAVIERWPPTRYVRPFAAIGFCGGFTTFSTLVVEVDQLGQHGRLLLASTYLITSVIAGLAAAMTGIGLARRQLPLRTRPSPIPDPDDLGLLNNDVDPVPPDDPGPVERQDGGRP